MRGDYHKINASAGWRVTSACAGIRRAPGIEEPVAAVLVAGVRRPDGAGLVMTEVDEAGS